MIELNINGIKKTYEEGTTYYEIAKEYLKEYKNDIVLVNESGKLSELNKKAASGKEISFVTTDMKAGHSAYQKSAVFILMKAFYDIVGSKNIEKVTLDCSLSKGFFIRPKIKVDFTEELLEKIAARMREMVSLALPINKVNIDTEEAIERFRAYGMYDKEKLFNYRRVSKVNLYRINDFEDYYYGYMCPNCSYVKYFELHMYREGFVIQLPVLTEPKVIPPFEPQHKLYEVLKKSSDFYATLEIPDIGSLNDRIVKGNINELVLIQEAVHENQLAGIAETFVKDSEKKLIMIAGPSSSGKTTFSHRMSIELLAHGLKPHPIAMDDYFVNRTDTPKDENGDYDYECLEAIDVAQFNHDMEALLRGETVNIPSYNFKTGKREYRNHEVTLGSEDVLIIEGIHGLNPKLADKVSPAAKFKIYLSALTQLNIDEHNHISTTDSRLLRRMLRDSRTRGVDAAQTINMWPSVRRGEEKNIFPFQEEADIMFNSALIYELAVLKPYVEPLLFRVQRDTPEYQEAKRMLKFLDYVLPMPSENIPANSILREFIGGTCFNI
jgi:Uridine kinase